MSYKRNFKGADADIMFFECMDKVVVWHKYFINNFSFPMHVSVLIAKGYLFNQQALETGHFKTTNENRKTLCLLSKVQEHLKSSEQCRFENIIEIWFASNIVLKKNTFCSGTRCDIQACSSPSLEAFRQYAEKAQV